MNVLQRIICAAAFASVLAAQTAATTQPQPHYEQRVFVLKYADARSLSNVLSVFGYGVTADRDMHVIAVRAPAEVMAAIADAVKRLDVPAAAPKDIELTVYMLVASEQAAAGAELPAELQPVASELKRIIAYKNFHLLDSILLRTQLGNRASTSGVVGPQTNRWPYDFTVSPVAVTEDPSGRQIRLDNLDLNVHLSDTRTATIRTEITVREGQRVVVGKSNVGIGEALILVVTAKVVNY